LAGDGAQFDAIILDLQRLRLLGALSEDQTVSLKLCLKSGPF